MKIIGLKAENFMNLKAVNIQLNGQALVIRGKNGEGKTSVLNIVIHGLGGKRYSGLDEPIMHGETTALTEVETEKWIVRRDMTATGDRLVVRSVDGKARFESPQAMLNECLGDLTADPSKFKFQKPKEQREIVMKLAGLDFTGLDKERAGLYVERTAANREVGKYQGALDSRAPIHEHTPQEPVEVKTLMGLLDTLNANQDRHQAYLRWVDGIEARQRGINQEITEQREEIRFAEKAITRLEAEYGELANSFDQNDIVQAVSEDEFTMIRNRIEQVDETNKRVRENESRLETEDALNEAKALKDSFTQSIEAIDAQKDHALANAAFPIEGLGVNDEHVLFHGIPLSQISDGEAMKVSTVISMALNPSLKVVFLRQATLLDGSQLKAVLDLCKERDYQPFVELVADGPGETGFYIEDGSVVGNQVEPHPLEVST